jgi:hypothetical protein
LRVSKARRSDELVSSKTTCSDDDDGRSARTLPRSPSPRTEMVISTCQRFAGSDGKSGTPSPHTL